MSPKSRLLESANGSTDPSSSLGCWRRHRPRCFRSGRPAVPDQMVVLTLPRCGLRTPRELADALAFAAGEAGPPMATAPRTASGAVAPVADRLVFTVEEAAQLLGISRSFAYEAVRRGDIPSIRIGRRILVPKAALHRLLDLSESEDGKN